MHKKISTLKKVEIFFMLPLRHGRTSRASLHTQAFSVLRTSKTCLQ
jgi:hypothetical protein